MSRSLTTLVMAAERSRLTVAPAPMDWMKTARSLIWLAPTPLVKVTSFNTWSLLRTLASPLRTLPTSQRALRVTLANVTVSRATLRPSEDVHPRREHLGRAVEDV